MTSIIDTHILLWYLSDDDRLPNRLEQKIQSPEIEVIIPIIVLIESVDIIKKERVDYPIEKLLLRVTATDKFYFKNLDMDVVMKISEMDTSLTLHDRIIVATADIFDSKILTIDEEIEKFAPEKVV